MSEPMMSRTRAPLEFFEAEYIQEILGKLSAKPNQMTCPISDENLEVISRKCLAGDFRFSPYKERLILKGRNKYPRIISIPSLRDKLVLRSITEILQEAFPESAKTTSGTEQISRVIQHIASDEHQLHWVYRGDIKNFYDNINRQQLYDLLIQRIHEPLLITLIQRALVTPTIPDKTRRQNYYKFKREKGVPQGLSISSILANLYLQSVDEVMEQVPKMVYLRFVDDIILIGDKDIIDNARSRLAQLFVEKELALHDKEEGKESFNPVSQTFGYLGYEFRLPTISVRESSVERLRNSIIALLKEAKSNAWSDDDLIFRLNLRITGAFSPKKTYGWLFYYRNINDIDLLYTLDAFVLTLLNKNSTLPVSRHNEIKRFVRAYHEIKHSVDSGYIHQYETKRGEPVVLDGILMHEQMSYDI